MIEFRLVAGSGVATYAQLVQQVRQALRLGVLRVGDQLPTVREVVASLAINPNTVARAYRELEAEGLVEGRQGQGTFVVSTLAGSGLEAHAALRRQLEAWMKAAADAGLDQESMVALFDSTLRGAGRLEGAA
jgi:GntR family transcriptional regulator